MRIELHGRARQRRGYSGSFDVEVASAVGEPQVCVQVVGAIEVAAARSASRSTAGP